MSIELTKARIALAHATEIKHQIRLMVDTGMATPLDYSNAVLNWIDAVAEVMTLEHLEGVSHE